MRYQDFTIDIRSTADNRYEATVVDAPIREIPRIVFEPLTQEELAQSPEQVGQRLFSSLFQGDLANLFEHCRTAVARDGDCGLRLRLKFRMDDLKAEELASYPWEWIWDAQSKSFLATERKSPIVRDYASRYFQSTLAVDSPLRILVVAAEPRDLHELNLGHEIDRLAKALGPLQEEGWVELIQLEQPSPEALRHALLDQGIHVLHFMGHGGYDEATKYGALSFLKRDKTNLQVHGEWFADCLKDIPNLRLVVLNACWTARHAGHSAVPLQSGVAAAVLERAGVPAVIANQHAIGNKAAVAFSETFYRRIAGGDGVEEALTEARFLLRPTSHDWATPVLFLGAQDGNLFAVRPPKVGSRIIKVIGSKDSVRLGVRSFVGYGGDMWESNEKLLDLPEYFDGRFIRNPADWQGKIFPELREFLAKHIDPRRPVLLDLAAHASIAFAAGWLSEAKSGLDVGVFQRTSHEGGGLEWHPDDGSAGEGPFWLERPDTELFPGSSDHPDVALALSVSQPGVVEHVQAFISAKGLPVGRIIDATIAPEPGLRAVRGGAHALHLAQTLLPRIRQRYPHERRGKLHVFAASPNALLFYLGQVSRALETIVLYEFAFGAEGSFGRYQRSIELPPPEEQRSLPNGW